VVRVKVAKDVPRKQRHINFDNPVDPLPPHPIKRRKNRVSLASQALFNNLFMTRSNVQSIPAAGASIELRKGRAWQFDIVTLGSPFHTTS
jgi:hypothetical protein